MRRSIGHLLAFGVIVGAQPDAASAQTTQELLRICEVNPSGYCLGYMAGFYDGRTTSDYGLPHLRSCPPTDESGLKLAVGFEQMVAVFVKWARDHPENLHSAQWQSVRQAVADAWPCGK